MKTLYVKRTNNLEISKEWKIPTNLKGELYATCSKKGIIKWETTKIYSLDELLVRGHVIRVI